MHYAVNDPWKEYNMLSLSLLSFSWHLLSSLPHNTLTLLETNHTLGSFLAILSLTWHKLQPSLRDSFHSPNKNLYCRLSKWLIWGTLTIPTDLKKSTHCHDDDSDWCYTACKHIDKDKDCSNTKIYVVLPSPLLTIHSFRNKLYKLCIAFESSTL